MIGGVRKMPLDYGAPPKPYWSDATGQCMRRISLIRRRSPRQSAVDWATRASPRADKRAAPCVVNRWSLSLWPNEAGSLFLVGSTLPSRPRCRLLPGNRLGVLHDQFDRHVTAHGVGVGANAVRFGHQFLGLGAFDSRQIDAQFDAQ